MRRICKRCHRVRAVNGSGYCPGCADTLDDLRKPRRRAQAQETPEGSDASSEEELAEASTDPAPATSEPAPETPPEDRNTMPDAPSVKAPAPEETAADDEPSPETPRSESLASEPPASGVKT